MNTARLGALSLAVVTCPASADITIGSWNLLHLGWNNGKRIDAVAVGEAAKTIGTGRTRFFSFLRRNGWVNRRKEPYQSKIEAGYMDVKIGHWEHPERGLQENITALVTDKGPVKLQHLWDSQPREVV